MTLTLSVLIGQLRLDEKFIVCNLSRASYVRQLHSRMNLSNLLGQLNIESVEQFESVGIEGDLQVPSRRRSHTGIQFEYLRFYPRMQALRQFHSNELSRY